jgi:hypothetical protein
MPFVPTQSDGHSAHLGQEIEVCYRWHALYGRRVRRFYSEQRAAGQFVHIEAAPGLIIALAAWMLDPVACAGMGMGAPRAAVTALIDLHRLLFERGFRASSLSDSRIIQEEHNEQTVKIGSASAGSLAPAQHCVRFNPTSGNEPDRACESARALGESIDASGRGRSGGATK